MWPDPASTFYMSATFLTTVLLTPEGYRVVTEGIQHGLLRVIVTCGQGHIPKEFSKRLECLLMDLLAPSTVRYHLLEEMRDAIAKVDDAVSSPSFQKSQMFEAWSKFAAVTKARVEVSREFDSDFGSQRACDFPKYRVISEKMNFKRCRGCLTLFYCSKACQALDWRQGGHKRTCAMYRARHINVHRYYTPRERAFLRTLLASGLTSTAIFLLAQSCAPAPSESRSSTTRAGTSRSKPFRSRRRMRRCRSTRRTGRTRSRAQGTAGGGWRCTLCCCGTGRTRRRG
ncbi:hypothetical protein C8R47DRAFT_248806 [Mycena vitilis]|nr:hypothetical protein C8R47DRAFT_248806 [Mycena vitilis]